jgi:ABC-type polar amino acid transport system ATPase subunit
VTGAVHLSAKSTRLPKKLSGGKKNAIEAPTDFDEPTFSSLDPTGHVNLLLDGKVISLLFSDRYDGL